MIALTRAAAANRSCPCGRSRDRTDPRGVAPARRPSQRPGQLHGERDHDRRQGAGARERALILPPAAAAAAARDAGRCGAAGAGDDHGDDPLAVAVLLPAVRRPHDAAQRPRRLLRPPRGADGVRAEPLDGQGARAGGRAQRGGVHRGHRDGGGPRGRERRVRGPVRRVRDEVRRGREGGHLPGTDPPRRTPLYTRAP